MAPPDTVGKEDSFAMLHGLDLVNVNTADRVGAVPPGSLLVVSSYHREFG